MSKHYVTDQVTSDSSNNSPILNYVFYNSNHEKVQDFSLLVEDSDWYAHENILNSLIGNLVKFSSSGKLEPYLADKFEVSSDSLTWKYHLRANLVCDDGTQITAKNFVEALHRQIKKYSATSRPIDFENLMGFTEFNESKSENIAGLTYDLNTIIFQFNKKPEDLNEMLRMPYFGFWCEKNLNGELWKNNKQFISSSAFKLISANSKKIIIQKRTDWFTSNNDSIDKIAFTYQNHEGISKLETPLIVEAKSSDNIKNIINSSFIEIMGLPTLVYNLILSPYKNSQLEDNFLRLEIANRIRKNQSQTKFINTDFFYKFLKSEVKTYSDEKILNKYKNMTFKLATLHPPNDDLKEFISFLNKIFADLNISFKLVYENKNFSEWRKELNSNLNFDGRFGGVANGSKMRNFIVKMMFCTDLGVSYPDPSGRICSLVKKQEEIGGPISEEYIKEFNQILYEDSSVIPLQNLSFVWYISPEIDPMSFPPTAEHPLFEKLKLK